MKIPLLLVVAALLVLVSCGGGQDNVSVSTSPKPLVTTTTTVPTTTSITTTTQRRATLTLPPGATVPRLQTCEEGREFDASCPTTTVAPTTTTEPSSGSRIDADEFGQIEIGMTESEVIAIVGGEGELMTESASGKILQFQGFGSLGANALIQFQNDRVIVKSQIGLKSP